MSDIRQILEWERHNDKHIRLYRIGRYWFAFERSAFTLFSACCVDTIIKVGYIKEEKSSMLITVVKNEMCRLYNPQFTVLERSENEILINSGIVCRGFQYWKENLISLSTKSLSQSEDEFSYDIYHLNLEMLLPQLDAMQNRFTKIG